MQEETPQSASTTLPYFICFMTFIASKFPLSTWLVSIFLLWNASFLKADTCLFYLLLYAST